MQNQEHDSKNAVLAVDLDGSLIKTDLLLESLLLLIKSNPLYLVCLPFWLLQGKVKFKYHVASRVELNAALLPYNNAVIEYIQAFKLKGGQCFLITGSVTQQANQVSDYLGLFDGVYGTDIDGVNLTGNHKAKFLNDLFSKKHYDYIGNSKVDLAVWASSNKAIVVSSNDELLHKAAKVSDTQELIAVDKANLKTFLKCIRLHQWIKNVLMVVPLLTSHQVFDIHLIWLCFIGFMAFSLAASSVYVLNDLMDLESDRAHPSKKHRPFASGALSIQFGLILFPLLLVTSLALCVLLPFSFFMALVAYYLVTIAYSFKLKQVILLDTIILAVLYTMRIIAGTLLISVSFSYWLLAFSIFIFFSLALVKRYVELMMLRKNNQLVSSGRGYRVDDASIIASLGTASGLIAVLVLALYLNSNAVVALYQHASFLWVACLILLYWVSRIWLLAHRGEMNDDPILFAVKDMNSLITAACILAVFVCAI